MSWIAAAGAVVSIAGGIAGSKSKKKAQKKAAQERLNMIQSSYNDSKQQMELNAGLDDYYKQLDARDRYLGGLNYAGYNTVNDYAPEYQNTSAAPIIPEKPRA